MIIQHNPMAINAHRNLKLNINHISKHIEKISTGKRIVRAADDVANLGISERMKSSLTALQQTNKNSNDTDSMLQTAEGALQSLHEILNRMLELSRKSSNGISDNNTDRQAMQKEYRSLLDEIDSISLSTNFNGLELLNNSLEQSRAEVSNCYASDFEVTMRNIINEAIISKNDSAIIFGEGGKIQFFVDKTARDNNSDMLIGDISSKGLMLDTTSIETIKNARRSIEFIQDAVNRVSQTRANVGVAQNRLEFSVRSNNSSYENLLTSQSKLTDIDVAKAMTEVAKTEIIKNAAQSALAQANVQPVTVLGLINKTPTIKSPEPKTDNLTKTNKPATKQSVPASKPEVKKTIQLEQNSSYKPIKKQEPKAMKKQQSFSAKI